MKNDILLTNWYNLYESVTPQEKRGIDKCVLSLWNSKFQLFKLENKIWYFFCFVQLRWCHNGWASNNFRSGYLSIMTSSKLRKTVDAHPLWHHQRCTKQKNTCFFFSHSYLKLCYFGFYQPNLFVKNIITFCCCHLKNYTSLENKCF